MLQMYTSACRSRLTLEADIIDTSVQGGVPCHQVIRGELLKSGLLALKRLRLSCASRKVLNIEINAAIAALVLPTKFKSFVRGTSGSFKIEVGCIGK